MKTIKVSLFLIFFVSCISVFAFSPPPSSSNNNQCGNNVSVPLDGGLLFVLGAAGVSYFLARKNRNKKDI